MIQFTAVESIFFAALEKPAGPGRAAFLSQACGADADLRGHVERMLAAHPQAGSFLNAPAPSPVATIDEPPIAERPGTVIRPYKLLEQIGEGGMGIVFMAEQQQPLRRRVALKIIKPGMDSKQVIARFEAERQTLALMDHQNIAKVLDAGATESGRPYFVMELVHGVPITQYCDDHHLTPKARLELFLPVCHAIQHAHQKGIIHRDLKPSNVLVCLYDGVAVPKVIDFGVAKATGQQLTERTVFTQFGTLVGTLEYMSPEQAEMSQLGIDTRSDVYALGVLLYELLTGTTPLERHRPREAGFDEIRRLIREEEPPKPSTRLSASGVALAAISAQRQTEPAKLAKLVRGELDWIVMRCLEKDRTRRYETANGLARDVERYLHDEPVEACPPTAGYKLRKFARKNRKLLATAAGFAVLLLLDVAGSLWQAVRATQAEAVALANEQPATANAAQAQEKEHEANQQRDEAQKQRDEVRALNEKLQATQAELRTTLYAAHINLAQRAWEETASPRALELLERYRPEPGESDLRSFEWHYLRRLCQGDQLFTLPKALNVVFSPDGKHLITIGGEPGDRPAPELKIWDAETGQELRKFTLDGADLNYMVFSPDGQRLASGFDSGNKGISDSEKKVKVWDTQTGQELLSLKGGSWFVVFSPDGKRLASPSGREVYQWDAQTGQELPTLKGGPTSDFWWSLAFSPDGKRLASHDYKDRTVKVWDAQTGQQLLSLKGGHHSVAFSPDGKRIVSGSGPSVPQGKGEVNVWDAQTGQELLSLKEPSGFTFFMLSPDGKRFATADANETRPRIRVWDAQTGQLVFTFQGHTSQVQCMAFTPDSKRLASSSGDRTLRIWDLQTGEEIRTLRGHAAGKLVFSPDGKRLASAGGEEVKLWDAQKDDETIRLTGIGRFAPGPIAGEPYVVFSQDLRRVASMSNKTVKVWNAHNGQELLTLKGHTTTVRCVAFGPDGRYLASGDGGNPARGDGKPAPTPGEVKVWDAKTGQELHTLKGHNAPVFSVAFSPDGKRLASASQDRMVKVWDTQTGQELLSTPKEPQFSISVTWSVAFSPDGKRLATVSPIKVMLWDAQTGQEQLTIQQRTGWLASVTFSPDGMRLAVLSDDKTVKVWDAQTGQELLSLEGHLDLVRSVAFSPDGKRLASASTDMVKGWDAQTGQELLSLRAHTELGGSVAFSPDGHRLGIVSRYGTVKFWDATPLPEKP